jgi:hypothetical protein
MALSSQYIAGSSVEADHRRSVRYLTFTSAPDIARCWPWLALLVVLIVGGWHDASLLLHYSTAVGHDGYYYVLQINTLKSTGHFYFPTQTPLVLYLLAGFTRLIGDTVIAIKIASVLLSGLLGLGVFALVTRTTNRAGLAVLGAALVVFPSLHIFMIAEFIKLLGALTLLVWCAWSMVMAFKTRRAVWVVTTFLLLLFAALSHVSALPIALIVAASAGLCGYASTLPPRRRLVVYVLIVLVLFAAPAIIARQPFLSLPEWLRSELLTRPQWPIQKVAFNERLILLAVAPAILFLLIRGRIEKSASKIAAVTFGSVDLWALFVNLNPFLSNERGWFGITGRLSGLTYLQLAVLIPGLFVLLPADAGNTRKYLAWLCGPVLILTLFTPLPVGLSPSYLRNRAEMIQNLRRFQQTLGETPIVIAAHGDQFLITALLNVPSQQRAPTDGRYGTVYWLLHYVKSDLLDASSSYVARDRDESFTVFIKDNDLQQILRRFDFSEFQDLLRHNPHLETSYGSRMAGSVE